MRVTLLSCLCAGLLLGCGGPSMQLGRQLQSQSDRLHDDCTRGAAPDDCAGHRQHLVCMLEKVEALPRETDEEVRKFVVQCSDSRHSVNELNRSCGEQAVEMLATLDDLCGQFGG